MQDMSKAERLHEIVNEMLAPFGETAPAMTQGLAGASTPIDTTKPNFHDSKAEFTSELHAVERSMENIQGLLDTLARDSGDARMRKMQERLSAIVDIDMRDNAQGSRIETGIDMARQNVAMAGGYFGSMFVLLDLWKALGNRHQELKDQELQFWNQSNRAPDHYARAIALRLARLYARKTGERPTVGTSPETGDPSTHYTRALQEVYAVLAIKRRARHQASWAVDQITDDDLNPMHNTLGSLLAQDLQSHPAKSARELALELTQQAKRK